MRTVYNLLVHRNAERSGERRVSITQETRNRSVSTDKIFRNGIQFLGRYAGLDVFFHFGQRFRHENVVLAEQFYFFLGF